MKQATAEKRWLIADIGGTNSRLAVWHPGPGRGELVGLRKLSNAAYVQIDDMLGSYLDGYDGEPPTGAVLAIAGPVTGDAIRLLNIDWSFTVPGLRETLGLGELIAINDFEALAHVVPVLRDDEFHQIGGGQADPDAPVVLVGPGTGLGVASLVRTADRHIAVPGEGGHVSLPANNADEARIIETVRDRFGHCSAERILSGAGLAMLHELLHGEALTAAEISQRGKEGNASAIATFEQFFAFLGTVAGNVALTLGAHGGVYIGGGIVLANLELFERSGFRERFTDKGRYHDYLDAIPTRVITLDTPALVGLAGLVATL
ncbi:MAG: glucokinase [Pseudomonadota bacterium]